MYISDLIDLYAKSINNIDLVKGQIFNVGGGPTNQLSLLELISIIEKLSREKISYSKSDWRPGDQKIYVSDIRRVEEYLRWSSKTDVNTGIEALYDWVLENQKVFA